MKRMIYDGILFSTTNWLRQLLLGRHWWYNGLGLLTVWGALVFGFFSVFGWNTGQKVWDKYIEPRTETHTPKEQKDDTGNLPRL